VQNCTNGCDEANENSPTCIILSTINSSTSLVHFGHFETNFSFPSLGFVSDQPSFPFFQNIDFVLVFRKMNVLFSTNIGCLVCMTFF